MYTKSVCLCLHFSLISVKHSVSNTSALLVDSAAYHTLSQECPLEFQPKYLWLDVVIRK